MVAEGLKREKREIKKYKARIPIPIKPEKPHSTKKGKKGYNRLKEKKKEENLIKHELNF